MYALNLKSSLALEDYADCNNSDWIYKDIAFQRLKEYRQNKDKMTEEELLSTTAEIVENFEKLFEKIGKENFVFHDDGDVEYIWPEI
ncbi:MAG: hypothetical protein ACLRFL_02050 [Clostridia bacterium]